MCMIPEIEIQQAADGVRITAYFARETREVKVQSHEPGIWCATNSDGSMQRIVIRIPCPDHLDDGYLNAIKSTLKSLITNEQLKTIAAEIERTIEQAKLFRSYLPAG